MKRAFATFRTLACDASFARSARSKCEPFLLAKSMKIRPKTAPNHGSERSLPKMPPRRRFRVDFGRPGRLFASPGASWGSPGRPGMHPERSRGAPGGLPGAPGRLPDRTLALPGGTRGGQVARGGSERQKVMTLIGIVHSDTQKVMTLLGLAHTGSARGGSKRQKVMTLLGIVHSDPKKVMTLLGLLHPKFSDPQFWRLFPK